MGTQITKNKLLFKRIACVVTAATVAVTSAFALAGCGKKNDAVSDEKVTISIANWPTAEPRLSRSNEKKAKFEAENPNIKIIPDSWKFDLQTFYPKAAAGLLPNQFTAYYSEITNLINSGYLADITDVAKETGIYDKLNPIVRDAAMKDGKLYAIPEDSYMLGIVVNIDMLNQAGYIEADGTPHQPKDWFELAEMAQKIKEVTGKPGLVIPTANNYGGWIFTQIAWGFGVNFMEKDGDRWKATFNSDECVQALQYIKDLKWKYDVLPANILVDKEYTKIFATGGAAMTISSHQMANTAVNYDMNKDSLGFVAIPAGPKGRYAMLGGMLIGFSNKTDKQQQRAIFKWLDLTNISDKETWKKNKEEVVAKGLLVGVKNLSSYTDESPKQKFISDWTNENTNVNPAHFKLYNDSLNDTSITLRAEEPRCSQDLYGILDGCIQNVLQNKDADCKALLEEANRNFQEQYLDDQEN